MEWGELVRERLVPGPSEPSSAATLVAVAVALVAISWGPLWRLARIGVTLAHEVGHAVVGLAVGRRFTGFVVSGDASGHAVTVGPVRGLGRVATTWAGYPAPAVAGLLLMWAGTRGYGALVVGLALLGSVLLLLLARSVTTVVTILVTAGLFGSLWWWRSDELQAAALVAVGLVLLVGTGRALAAGAPAGRAGDDPEVLRQLTRLPRWWWLGSWVVVWAAAGLASAWLLVA